MTAALARVAGTRLRGIPAAVPAAIALAWALSLAAQASGNARALHHDSLIEGGSPPWFGLALFLLAWQAMIVAMMLPSSLPLVRLFCEAAAGQPRAGRALAAFVGGYALVWSGFGALVFTADVGLHDLVHRVALLEAGQWAIGPSVLALAGAFQFTSLKDRCLHQCRHPTAFLLRHYERGAAGAFRLGRRHGLFCLGCCWTLMLVTFAVGVANLWWMAALTTVMVYEKTGAGGRRAVPVTGLALLGVAGIAVV